MNDVLSRLMQAAHQAIARGDTYVGLAEDFPSVSEVSRLMSIPVGIFEGRVLLKLRDPLKAVTLKGSFISIVSHYGGVYYGLSGDKFTVNQLAFVTEKELP